MRDFLARMGILGELLQFLWRRKLYEPQIGSKHYLFAYVYDFL